MRVCLIMAAVFSLASAVSAASPTDRPQSSSVQFTRPRLSAPTTARTTWNTNFSRSRWRR